MNPVNAHKSVRYEEPEKNQLYIGIINLIKHSPPTESLMVVAYFKNKKNPLLHFVFVLNVLIILSIL